MFVTVVVPGGKQASIVDVEELSYESIKEVLGGDFAVLEIPGLKEKNIDVFALTNVTKTEKPSIVIVDEKVTPPIVTDSILGKVVFIGVDENKNTVPLTEEQMGYLSSSCNEFTTVGTLGGKIIHDVLTFKA